MDLLTQNDLKNLTNEHEDFCVSIFMPAAPISGGDINNPVQFKDLLREVESRLKESSLNNRQINSYLKPAINLSENDTFWKDQFSSLIAYLHKSGISTFKLPLNLKQEVIVSHYCDVLPVLEYFSQNGSYFLLLIDEGGCHLYRADHYSIKDITPNEIKKPKKEIINYLLVEEEQLFHSGRNDGRDKKHEAVMYYGHGNEKDDRKIRALEYLQQVEKHVADVIKTEHDPLILAGHQFVTSIYRGVNTYRNLLDDTICPNPGPADLKYLHDESWKVASLYYKEIEKEEKSKYCDLTSTKLVSCDPVEIVKSAKYGRVGTLFINLEKEVWGTLENKDEIIDIKITNDKLDENLTNLAADYTLKSSGKIYALKSNDMPEDRELCAIFRY